MKRYSHQQIEALLDKFMDGQTTVEEEAQLADYFRSADVPAEWEDYRAMFDYFDSGMESEPVPAAETRPSLTSQVGRRWWGISAAACITAAIVATALLHHPTTTTVPDTPPVIAQKADTITTPVAVEAQPEPQPQQLAAATPVRPTRPSRPVSKSSRRLQAENKRLADENERLQRELADLKRRSFIIDLEANGFRAVQDEDGSIVLIDLEQELENELNNKLTTNIPAL